jgi:DNA repair protein RadC
MPLIKYSKNNFETLFRVRDDNKNNLIGSLYVVLFNCHDHVLGFYQLSSGGQTCAIADVILLEMAAFKANAVILTYMHSCGTLKRSKHDEELTLKIIQAGKYLDIQVLDHIIVTGEAPPTILLNCNDEN